MLCKTSHVLEEESKTAAIARTLGLPADVLDARQTAALDPNIQMDVAGSVYFPKDCHLSPDRFMRTLEAISFDLGVRFVWESGVVGWRTTGQRIDCVQTSSGEFSADEYVLAAGAWSDVLGRDLGLSIPIQSGKGYSLTLSTPPQLPQICSILTEARVAVTPMGAALRVGGTMEISGLDETISGRRVQGIIKAVSQYYPAFNKEHFAGVQPWAGLRPCSPDGLPYVGRTRRYTNLCVATGHAMMGLSLGPITGKLVSEILSEVSPSIPINLLDPDRYL
jgi:D-amino-acid dehydrogenase